MRLGLALIAMLTTACAPRLYDDSGDFEWVPPEENSWAINPPPPELEPEGMAEGQVALDIRGLDQFGEEVALWQFYGRHVILDISTIWCEPCRELGMGTEYVYQKYLDGDAMYLTVIVENADNEPPTLEEVQAWTQLPAYHPDDAHPYELITAPVIADPKGISGSTRAVRNQQYPVVLHIGPDLKVWERIEPTTEARIEEVLETYL